MEVSKYPKYTFTWLGGLVLLGGYIFGSIIIGGMMVLWDVVCRESIQDKEWFVMVANAVVFISMIAAFDFIMVRPTTKKSSVLIFPLLISIPIFLFFP